MNIAQHIFRIFFLIFGIFYIGSNSFYLIKKNGLKFARKLYLELPDDIPLYNIGIKVISMLTFGILFFIITVVSFFTESFYYYYYIVILIMFFIYSLIEAFFYRYWKTFLFSVTVMTVLLLFVIFT